VIPFVGKRTDQMKLNYLNHQFDMLTKFEATDTIF
jgi:hypothetical protein